jgi:hypothetical protein
MADTDHPPGSPEAIAQGCTCSPVLNRHGRGTLHGEPPFYRAKDCPLHQGQGVQPAGDKGEEQAR